MMRNHISTDTASSSTQESSPAAAPLVPFRFELELAFHFQPGSVSDVSRATLHVVDYAFPPSYDRAARDEAKACLKPLVLPHLEYNVIWRRPLHRLPVHKDVPRLLKGMLVTGPDGEVVYKDDGSARPANPAAQVASLKALFCSLCQALDSPSVQKMAAERFDEFCSPESGDVAASFRSFLLESLIPDEALSIQVLKCVHQEMIFPAVSALRNSIYTVLPYKDIKGEWRVAIDIGVDHITVSHRKWEQTHEHDAVKYHKFRWCAALTFDRRMRSLNGVTLSVIDFEFGGATSEEHKRIVLAALKPWLAPGVLYKRVWSSLQATGRPRA